MNKFLLKETLNYPNQHKSKDNIDFIDILIYDTLDTDELLIAYYDWYGDIDLEAILFFVEDHFSHKLFVLNANDGNGRVNITFKFIKDLSQ